MTDRPLTERMLGVLRVLDTAGIQLSNNEIGMRLGFWNGMEGTRTSHNGKRMGPANRVNFAVTALEHRGLVQFSSRRDGLSGSAYRITDAGREALRNA